MIEVLDEWENNEAILIMGFCSAQMEFIVFSQVCCFFCAAGFVGSDKIAGQARNDMKDANYPLS